MGNYPSSQINLHSAQNVTREYCSGVINSWQNLGSNADINYWAEECIKLNPGFEIQLGGEMLADIKPYGKETFFWTIKDHKQNVRSILDDDGNVMHHMNYYPFNLRHDFNDAPAYEWNVEGALEMTGVAPHLDVMAFRVCDRLMGRFNSVDKLSAAMPNWNGYQMSFNNPMNYIDPTGLMPSTTYDGQELAKEKSGEREERQQELDAKLFKEKENTSAWPPEGGFIFQTHIDSDGSFVHDGNGWVNTSDGSSVTPEGPSSTGNENSSFVSKADAAGTAISGVGLDWRAINRAGNSGSRFRADIFYQNIIRFKGVTGQNIVTGIKYGAPVFSIGSALLTFNSDATSGWKIADLAFTGFGALGGQYGALS